MGKERGFLFCVDFGYGLGRGWGVGGGLESVTWELPEGGNGYEAYPVQQDQSGLADDSMPKTGKIAAEQWVSQHYPVRRTSQQGPTPTPTLASFKTSNSKSRQR